MVRWLIKLWTCNRVKLLHNVEKLFHFSCFFLLILMFWISSFFSPLTSAPICFCLLPLVFLFAHVYSWTLNLLLEQTKHNHSRFFHSHIIIILLRLCWGPKGEQQTARKNNGAPAKMAKNNKKTFREKRNCLLINTGEEKSISFLFWERKLTSIRWL